VDRFDEMSLTEMKMYSLRAVARRIPIALTIALTGMFVTVSAHAETTSARLSIGAGKGEMVRLAEPATSVFVADPDIADVQVPNPRAVFVLGKKAGTTTLYVLGANNQEVLRETIVVSQDIGSLEEILRARFPSLQLKLAAAPGSLMVSGNRPQRHAGTRHQLEYDQHGSG
jgi:pilus assembly protein CpaC